MLEKTLESPLDCKDIQSVHSEGDQPWDFFGRNDAKADLGGVCVCVRVRACVRGGEGRYYH